ncbi:MAG: YraN family protein [Halofilum sp. (in: g-proteobacteria)]
MTDRAARGQATEQLVQSHLMAHGLRLRTRNHRCRWGEIDLVMDDGTMVVFVEVRYRARSDFGGATASVDAGKQRRLIRAAQDYLARNRLATRPTRFDVAAVGPDQRIDWIQGAFDAS